MKIMLQTLKDCEEVVGKEEVEEENIRLGADIVECIKSFNDVFVTSMSEDLHSPVVLSAMSDPLKTANDLLHTRKVLHFYN